MTDRLDEHSRRELLAYRMQRAVETLEEADCLAGNGLYSGAINLCIMRVIMRFRLF